MRKHATADTFPYVEHLPVARVTKEVDVSPERLSDLDGNDVSQTAPPLSK